MKYIFPLLYEKEEVGEEELLKISYEIEKKQAFAWLSSNPSEKKFASLNIFDYSLHLTGKHAID